MSPTPTILLVCEETILAQTINFVLQKNEFKILVCHDGHTALEILKSEPVDYLITEILLPFYSGFDLIHHFVQSHTFKNILLLCVFENPGLMERSLNFIPIKQVFKPYNLQEINQIVKERLIPTQYIHQESN